MQHIYIYDYVNAFGFIQGVLLSMVIFFYPGGNRSSNKFLALHLFCLSLALAAPFSLKLFSSISPRADRFTEPFLVLIYPFLYLYLKSFSQQVNPRLILFHIIPFLAFTPLVVLSLVYQQELTNWNNATFGFSFTLLVFVLIKIVLFVLYLFLCWKQTNRIRRSVENNFSEISRINLDWIKRLITAGIVLLIMYIIVMALIVANPSWAKLNFLMVGLVTIYIYYTSFKGLTQPAIFKYKIDPGSDRSDNNSYESQPIINTETERPKYERSSLPDSQQEELVKQLKDLMVKDRLFLEPELSIAILGEKLQVSPYYISQLLSQKLKTSFYDFINQYRVEEAKELLRKPSHENFTILSIAFDSGFNSKTTFNTVFKKFTAQTPTQFKSRLSR